VASQCLELRSLASYLGAFHSSFRVCDALCVWSTGVGSTCLRLCGPWWPSNNGTHERLPNADPSAGIESYNEGLDPVKAFVRWERDLPQLIRKLRNQHVHYAQTMRILLEPITTEFELAEMLSDPAGAQLWKDKHMAEKLQNKLQDSFFAYQSTITDIERITKKIASKLDLDRAAEVCAHIPRAFTLLTPTAQEKRP